MVSVTVSINEDIRSLMKQFPEMNWSGFVSRAIVQKVQEMKWREEMLRKLKAEEGAQEWAVGLQRRARKGRFEKLSKEGLV